ncbi:MAG: UDP-3-O-(3-hydroxymyristoyl)glucosamine N-acyltransferase [Anaerolineae bacterium]|nr:UDP-3-O-(3-hydroxymyristoyl)glucosamine N-acyltransferase [Gloeobacterales cyanobacterium ES-bin-313]
MKLSEIASKLGCTFEGDGDLEILGVATLEEAESGQITFLTNLKYKSKLQTSAASAVIVANNYVSDGKHSMALLRHGNPYLKFAQAIELFYTAPEMPAGIHPTAVIAPTATLGKNVKVGPHSVIWDDVVIGDDVTIHPNCVVYPGAQIGSGSTLHSNCVVREYVVLGERCTLQNGAVIGADGFGYAKQADGSWYKIRQSGRVVLGDDVEVGACSTIDRATIGETRVASGAKIDNLVMVGHGSRIGENTLLCGQVGLAGSTIIGRNAMLAGQVGVTGHLSIGDNAVITARSTIWRSVPANEVINGSIPACDSRSWLKSSAIFLQLPQLQKNVRELQAKIGVFESQQAPTENL